MWLIVQAFVMLVISYLLQPKVKQEKPVAGNLDAPTPQAGTPVPVLFGTNLVKSATIIWYGDARVVAIKSKGGKK